MASAKTGWGPRMREPAPPINANSLSLSEMDGLLTQEYPYCLILSCFYNYAGTVIFVPVQKRCVIKLRTTAALTAMKGQKTILFIKPSSLMTDVPFFLSSSTSRFLHG